MIPGCLCWTLQGVFVCVWVPPQPLQPVLSRAPVSTIAVTMFGSSYPLSLMNVVTTSVTEVTAVTLTQIACQSFVLLRLSWWLGNCCSLEQMSGDQLTRSLLRILNALVYSVLPLVWYPCRFISEHTVNVQKCILLFLINNKLLLK